MMQEDWLCSSIVLFWGAANPLELLLLSSHCMTNYQRHLMYLFQQLKPASLVESFELLDFYDEHLGHMMWYAPLFAAYLVYFYGSFGKSSSTGFGVWLLAIFGAGFEW